MYIDLQCRRSILVQAGVLLQIEAAGGLFSTGTMSEQIMLISPFMFTLLSAQAPEHAEHRAVKSRRAGQVDSKIFQSIMAILTNCADSNLIINTRLVTNYG